MKTLGIIPARFASTRFPGKPLAMLHGKPVIRWVWENVSLANELDAVVVATDDERIAKTVLDFGGRVQMTRPDHPSGTDRCAEVLISLGAHQWSRVVNIQGDEPFIDPGAIDLLVSLLKGQAAPPIATLARRIADEEQLFNPNVVKVAMSASGQALFFSRNPLPYVRGKEKKDWLQNYPFLQHIGLYGFQAPVLLEITQLQPSPLETAESLEQLRWLENGYGIAVALTEYHSLGIDTPEDLAEAEKTMRL